MKEILTIEVLEQKLLCSIILVNMKMHDHCLHVYKHKGTVRIITIIISSVFFFFLSIYKYDLSCKSVDTKYITAVSLPTVDA